MNASKEIENQPELILKLCKHLSKNETDLCSRLCNVAFSFLSQSSDVEELKDELTIVNEIKEFLKIKSPENVESFDLLYLNITKFNILKNRSAILLFLLRYAQSSSLNQFKWLEKKYNLSSLCKTKSLTIKNSNSTDSVRKLYENKRSICSTSYESLPSGQLTDTSKTCIDFKSVNSQILVSDREILQDVIYSFQGVEGKYLRKEPGGLGFNIDPKLSKSLTAIQYGLIERLIGMSFLHNQIKQYCDNNDKQSGIICQALIAILRTELSPYYSTLATLQDLLDKCNTTLRKTLVTIHPFRVRFEWLVYISDQCNDRKGGGIITSIHGFLQHGSTLVQEIAKRVLIAVCKPLFIMLSKWLLDGEINDPCGEFFIEIRHISTVERLWHDKYHVRQSMIPSFITMEQANKILATGKSINFLRQICKDTGQLPGRDSLQTLFKTTLVESLFLLEESFEFHSILDKVYQETSLRVLDLLKNKYLLYQHLQSLRRYLLLGQGDFIRHLLELLAPELNKPAQDIYIHTLTGILESAIRVTNAQFEDEDTLKRLNVSYMSHSNGDTGWDVFSLIYSIDGPVGTIFHQTMPIYQSLFGVLWKTKRMEFVLSNMRKQQITFSKLFRTIHTSKPVMHNIHILSSKMIHFLHQTQYYFLFEILECSWAEMILRVNNAECLDDIISAHLKFLNSVQHGVLLDESTRELFSQLRIIYNFILTLETYQNNLNIAAKKEQKAQKLMNEKIDNANDFGLLRKEELKNEKRLADFHHFLKEINTKVNTLAENFDLFVRSFLNLLSTNTSMNLQLLSVRLSFNDFYVA